MKYQVKKSEIINPVCELSLDYKIKVKAKDRKTAGDTDSMAEIFRSMYSDDIEFIERGYAALLNTNLQCLGVICIGEGETTKTLMDIRRAMQAALLCNATCISVCHNHPSGRLKPSRDDDNITNNIKKACDVMGFRFIDHIIITSEDYYSYRDNNKL